jgi:phosphoribosylanthranilate isomerase
MKIKICGITRLEDARYCAGAGADYLGFIQDPNSPRYVTPDAAREIISWIHGPAAVGVFVDESPETINAVANRVGFVYAQLHGNETPEECEDIDVPVIKALKVFPDTSVDALRRKMERYGGRVAHFLLDTGKDGMSGGTGQTFDWDVAAELALEYSIFLAGGLSPANVAGAVENVRPYAVDANSGLETSPGVKDADRITAFFEAVRTVDG